MPELQEEKIGVFVGAHSSWTTELTNVVERFCEKYNAVVLCDHTSNYKGKYKAQANLVAAQEQSFVECRKLDVMIYIGNITGAYLNVSAKQVWRVNIDGEVRDAFHNLRYVFEMEEKDFFEMYNQKKQVFSQSKFAKEWDEEYNRLYEKISDLPFSNVWVAKETSKRLPENCVLHLGILNSLRSWNLFKISDSVRAYANTGGFGTDGSLSTVLGASLANPEKLYFCVLGDLAFFYDINALGNRHVGNNLRIMLINNGKGAEFSNYNHHAARVTEETAPYISAAGHNGNKSELLVKNYTENLGFKYICAHNKEEYAKVVDEFVRVDKAQPVVFEIFTDGIDESEALKRINNLDETATAAAKKIAKDVLGEKGISTLKKIINH